MAASASGVASPGYVGQALLKVGGMPQRHWKDEFGGGSEEIERAGTLQLERKQPSRAHKPLAVPVMQRDIACALSSEQPRLAGPQER